VNNFWGKREKVVRDILLFEGLETEVPILRSWEVCSVVHVGSLVHGALFSKPPLFLIF
jgi:hypothetical protein